jgi:hypothetical protein
MAKSSVMIQKGFFGEPALVKRAGSRDMSWLPRHRMGRKQAPKKKFKMEPIKNESSLEKNDTPIDDSKSEPSQGEEVVNESQDVNPDPKDTESSGSGEDMAPIFGFLRGIARSHNYSIVITVTNVST